MKTSDFEIVSTDAENDQFNDLKLDFDPNLMVLSFQSSISFTQSYTQIYKLIGRRYSDSDASSDSIIDDENIGKSNKEVSIIIFHKKMISVPPVRGLHAHNLFSKNLAFQGVSEYSFLLLDVIWPEQYKTSGSYDRFNSYKCTNIIHPYKK